MSPAEPQPGRPSANRLESFRHAFAGWGALMRGTPNARIHLAIGLAAAAVGIWLGLSPTEWAIMAVTIGLVFTAEFMNSAIESVVDLASPEIHPLAKAAKDMAAGGVLFAACAAVAVGVLLFGPKLLDRFLPVLGGLLH